MGRRERIGVWWGEGEWKGVRAGKAEGEVDVLEGGYGEGGMGGGVGLRGRGGCVLIRGRGGGRGGGERGDGGGEEGDGEVLKECRCGSGAY